MSTYRDPRRHRAGLIVAGGGAEGAVGAAEVERRGWYSRAVLWNALEAGWDPVLRELESFPEKVRQIMGALPRKTRAAHSGQAQCAGTKPTCTVAWTDS